MQTEERIRATIEKMQRAEEEVRRLQDELLDSMESDRKATLAALHEAVVEGLGEGEGVEAAIALVPVAEVLGELEGPEVCDLLVDVLGSDEPEVRFTAGRALQDLAFDRYKEVAEAIERAATRLAADHHALRELPYVIAEVGEPGAPRVLGRYLSHSDPEVVAAAIEALASIGDPAALSPLEKLVRDGRTVQIEDDGGTQVSLGTLAQEAIEMIRAADDEDDAPPRRGPPGQRPEPPRRPQPPANPQRNPGGRPMPPAGAPPAGRGGNAGRGGRKR